MSSTYGIMKRCYSLVISSTWIWHLERNKVVIIQWPAINFYMSSGRLNWFGFDISFKGRPLRMSGEKIWSSWIKSYFPHEFGVSTRIITFGAVYKWRPVKRDGWMISKKSKKVDEIGQGTDGYSHLKIL